MAAEIVAVTPLAGGEDPASMRPRRMAAEITHQPAASSIGPTTLQ